MSGSAYSCCRFLYSTIPFVGSSYSLYCASADDYISYTLHIAIVIFISPCAPGSYSCCTSIKASTDSLQASCTFAGYIERTPRLHTYSCSASRPKQCIVSLKCKIESCIVCQDYRRVIAFIWVSVILRIHIYGDISYRKIDGGTTYYQSLITCLNIVRSFKFTRKDCVIVIACISRIHSKTIALSRCKFEWKFIKIYYLTSLTTLSFCLGFSLTSNMSIAVCCHIINITLIIFIFCLCLYRYASAQYRSRHNSGHYNCKKPFSLPFERSSPTFSQFSHSLFLLILHIYYAI